MATGRGQSCAMLVAQRERAKDVDPNRQGLAPEMA
jgi:hypothetical protein